MPALPSPRQYPAAAAERNHAVRHRLRQPARLLRLHRLRGPRQCGGGSESSAPGYSARHGPLRPAHLDGSVRARCRNCRQCGFPRTPVILHGAAQSGFPRSRRCQSCDHQHYRHRRDAEHHPCANDDGFTGDIRSFARSKFALVFGAGASGYGYTTSCHRIRRDFDRSAGFACSADVAGRDDRARNPLRYLRSSILPCCGFGIAACRPLLPTSPFRYGCPQSRWRHALR